MAFGAETEKHPEFQKDDSPEELSRKILRDAAVNLYAFNTEKQDLNDNKKRPVRITPEKPPEGWEATEPHFGHERLVFKFNEGRKENFWEFKAENRTVDGIPPPYGLMLHEELGLFPLNFDIPNGSEINVRAGGSFLVTLPDSTTVTNGKNASGYFLEIKYPNGKKEIRSTNGSITTEEKGIKTTEIKDSLINWTKKTLVVENKNTHEKRTEVTIKKGTDTETKRTTNLANGQKIEETILEKPNSTKIISMGEKTHRKTISS